MLVQFSVQNFRSIKERVTLSMISAEEESIENNVFTPKGGGGKNLLKTALIYGANASGKTTILKAMQFMLYLIKKSHNLQFGDEIEVIPFRLDKSCESQPSEFEIFFIHLGIEYCYGFIIDSDRVHEEYLYSYPNNKQTLVFERWDTNKFNFGEDVEKQQSLADMTLKNRLYLSNSTQLNYKPSQDIFEWFRDKLQIATNLEEQDWLAYTADKVHEDKKVKDLVASLLKNADIGISDINVSIKDVSEDDLPKSMPKKLRELLLTKAKNLEITTYHPGLDEEGNEIDISFELEDESRGTQRLFQLLGPWIEVLTSGDILVIDELESSLHPLLLEGIVKLFHDPIQNPHGAQLIFTTHNTNLLNPEIFGRDQIWFTEKDHSKGSTDLYSLSKFKPRKNENLEKGYLLGRYGAIPFFKGGSLL